MVEWIINTDQPFTIVENHTFRKLLKYTFTGKTLAILSADTIKRHIDGLQLKVFQKTKDILQI